MGTTNREWHVAHRMPPKPSEEQRGEWHAAHQEACGCRVPSEKEQALIDAWRAAHSSGG
ncbi:hypothetical protein RN607_04340 [Demequina capsici]|uniref:Uncharacterized protein n=1 Tax=Demequina capsici TaxID=3075620 RepID=A0AA96FDZ7_9MICO|nr:hypothetical protein [Demequina sp. PMTSA13]WNM28238.1 hypothetical protein RN607_04340 [Demequina sp. PMTSA13]